MDKELKKMKAMKRLAARRRRGRESPRNTLLPGSDGDTIILPNIRIALIATNEL